MSSHREAPEISKDPVADSTDLYAFVSPDGSRERSRSSPTTSRSRLPTAARTSTSSATTCSTRSTSTTPATASPDISYQFRFTTVNNIPASFLYNDGPITSLDAAVTEVELEPPADLHADPRRPQPGNRWGGSSVVLGSGLLCPPCNIGPLSTPNYAALATAAVHSVSGRTVLGQGVRRPAGRRLLRRPRRRVRPRGPARLRRRPRRRPGGRADERHARRELDRRRQRALAGAAGPVGQLTRSTPTGPSDPAAVIGVWTTASRQRVRVWGELAQRRRPSERPVDPGVAPRQPAGQRAAHRHRRQGPLEHAAADRRRRPSSSNYFAEPLLAQLLPGLYPGVFPNLATYNSGSPQHAARHRGHLPHRDPGRGDHPAPTFTNYNGTGVKADMLRLNTAIPPSSSPNSLGLLGLDVAGFPNGRRVFDDVATIALRAVAGATLGYVVADLHRRRGGRAWSTSGSRPAEGTDLSAKGTEHYLPAFPYLGTPYSGYSNPSTTPVSVAP